MTKTKEQSAAPFVPASTSLRTLAAAADGCRGCDLYKDATQTVFGEGPRRARLLLIGEQPGDQEDLQGHPFVGPAGALLDKALAEAGISRADVYLTNAVKHFKWEPRGKRRIHKKPRASEIKACRPWFDAELRAIVPAVIVCLGATAAQAVLGAQFKLMQQRGTLLPLPAPGNAPVPTARAGRNATAFAAPRARVLATIHPSAVLRSPDPAGRREAFEMLVGDLRTAATAAK